MNDKSKAEVEFEEELHRLTAAISAKADDDSLYYQRGRLYWRLGDKGKAISDYEQAVSINASSLAAEALKMARDVMNFYNKDLYNP